MYQFTAHKAGHLPCILICINYEEEEIGRVLLVPHSEEMYEVHLSAIAKPHRGQTDKILRECMDMVFGSLKKLQKLIGLVPEHNRLTVILCTNLGFTYEGTLKKSFLFDGEMVDQFIYGITRGEI